MEEPQPIVDNYKTNTTYSSILIRRKNSQKLLKKSVDTDWFRWYSIKAVGKRAGTNLDNWTVKQPWKFFKNFSD